MSLPIIPPVTIGAETAFRPRAAPDLHSADAGGDSAPVAEIQGLYGAFSFPEKLLQKIWLRGDFDRRAARTMDGCGVSVVHPGRWNLLGGPDFKGARLRFADGPEITGDVELHLHATDWDAHGHARDRAYDGVVLHVVLFPPDAGRLTLGSMGREIPVLALLPLLQHDLEAFAADEAVETLANQAATRIPEELGALTAPALDALLDQHAHKRWELKVHFARARVRRLGWEAACHHGALEVLGYRFNRVPMLRIANEWPLAAWREEPALSVRTYEAERAYWSLQGVRPANHPRRRLEQYAAWVAARPHWPDQLVRGINELSAVAATSTAVESETTSGLRRRLRLTRLRAELADRVCAGLVGGTRFDTLVCDCLLPLLAGGPASEDHTNLWRHWFLGDVPPVVRGSLRRLGVFASPGRPAAHGRAQGLIGWMLAREAKA